MSDADLLRGFLDRIDAATAPLVPEPTPIPPCPVSPDGAVLDYPGLADPDRGILRYWLHKESGKVLDEDTGLIISPTVIDKMFPKIKDSYVAGPAGVLPTTWLAKQRIVGTLGWLPGEPQIIDDVVFTREGMRRHPGEKAFNLYKPPTLARIPGDVSPWLNHVSAVYPNEAAHIVRYLAFKVQHPGDKVNHGLVFIGAPGIGKDTILAPAVAAVGQHNFQSISAATFFGSAFNGYLRSVLLRIDEVHDLGGETKYAFHDRTKTVLAAPPDQNRINEKHTPEFSAANVCGVILTSNHPDALYLERNDRRHFVCVSDRTAAEFGGDYFEMLYLWFANGGNEAVAHYLATLPLDDFNAKAPPPKTPGWHQMVTAGLAPEQNDLTDAIERLGGPAVLTLAMVVSTGMGGELAAAMVDPRKRKNLPKRFADAGYVPVQNPDALKSGGRWRVGGQLTVVYGRQEIGERARLAAAYGLTAQRGDATTPPIPVRGDA